MHQLTTPVFMELKYCERCGGLHLRRRGEPAAYCRPCARALELADQGLVAAPLRRGRPEGAGDKTPRQTGRTA